MTFSQYIAACSTVCVCVPVIMRTRWTRNHDTPHQGKSLNSRCPNVCSIPILPLYYCITNLPFSSWTLNPIRNLLIDCNLPTPPQTIISELDDGLMTWDRHICIFFLLKMSCWLSSTSTWWEWSRNKPTALCIVHGLQLISWDVTNHHADLVCWLWWFVLAVKMKEDEMKEGRISFLLARILEMRVARWVPDGPWTKRHHYYY